MPRKPVPPSTQAAPSLFDQPRPGSNMPEYSVSDLSKHLKRTVEETYGLVRVRGELGECKHHSSGHLYLSLKDEGAVLAAVCWRGQVAKLSIRPETGMEVVCTGRLTTYPGQSKYQMVVENMALAGMGALLKMLEERRQRLAAEGLFDADRKKKLPFLPKVIGVVTSPTGAVIRDILHRLADRFPRDVIVWPVPVQGEGAADQIAKAIRGFNALPVDGAVPRPDLLIVARGGGSVEDLMPFNEEVVVRAAAESVIPLISAVGHETDTTLIDYASDVRAPTPTAAAEMAVPVRAELLAQIAGIGGRLDLAAGRLVQERADKLKLYVRALGDPMRLLEPLAQRLDERADRLSLSWQTYFQRRQGLLAELSGKIRHPRDVLKFAAQQLASQSDRLTQSCQNYLQRRQSLLAEMTVRIRHPRDLLNLCAQRLTAQSGRLESAYKAQLMQTEKRLERLTTILDVLSPRAVLGRGYALIHDAKGQLVVSAQALQKGDNVRFELHDGLRGATISDDV